MRGETGCLRSRSALGPVGGVRCRAGVVFERTSGPVGAGGTVETAGLVVGVIDECPFDFVGTVGGATGDN
jgi:hypothetical protein